MTKSQSIDLLTTLSREQLEAVDARLAELQSIFERLAAGIDTDPENDLHIELCSQARGVAAARTSIYRAATGMCGTGGAEA